MPPSLAFGLWVVCAVAMLRWDPAATGRASIALWPPLLHFFIAASRPPTSWLGGVDGSRADVLMEGSPLDRNIQSLLMFLAIVTLVWRSVDWSGLVRRNVALVALLGFALISAAWSDYPLVSSKRWVRDLGSYLMVLVIATEVSPHESLRLMLRRLLCLLLSLSIVLHKYFPEFGRQYEYWSGEASFIGATTSKNQFGLLCLVSGLFFMWDTLVRWKDRSQSQTRQVLILNAAAIAATLWLLSLSDSATSLGCLAVGCAAMIAAHLKPLTARWLVPATLAACGLVAAVVGPGNITAVVAEMLGRDPTLTDRTEIWEMVLRVETNPLVGTGYETFWLGPRLRQIWSYGYGRITQAHNGYIQVYLNLGFVGVGLVLAFIVASYRVIWTQLDGSSRLGSFALASWVVLLIYNITEAAFLGGLLWLMLFAAVLVRDEGLPVAAAASTAQPQRARIKAFTLKPAVGMPARAPSAASSLINPRFRFRSSR